MLLYARHYRSPGKTGNKTIYRASASGYIGQLGVIDAQERNISSAPVIGQERVQRTLGRLANYVDKRTYCT